MFIFTMSYRCENCNDSINIFIYSKFIKWCKTCQINRLKQNYANWTSGNEKINDFIREMQLKIENYYDTIFEWIPYNQPIETGFINNVFCNMKIYGISQNPSTKDYVIVLEDCYCEKCGSRYTYSDFRNKWCEPCQINNLKQNFAKWTSGNEIIDEFIQKMQLKIESCKDIIVEWIPYNQFKNITEISKNNSASIHSAIWINGPLRYERKNKNITGVLMIVALQHIINGLKIIHDNQMVHRDFHTGNILTFNYMFFVDQYISIHNTICISDMGLCGEVCNIDETKIYGVMPYVAPEVLRGKPYTQAADIYSFGMIMYFVATGKQHFVN
ncbi:hypothetical protein RclHR1_03910010 [Rhizophagus clarus]|uniref:Protein kinase domain-containing protein n=1 Tax=Rhizophagus clarus TaxID=94130 RepID=A0A2Z6RHN5_9GLOM|nr:hypothetical protein RclHR1_03910010 [Rhizophagus clarus]